MTEALPSCGLLAVCDVQVRHHLEPADEMGRNIGGKLGHVVKDAVNPSIAPAGRVQ
jgi:hypothetical protein